MAKIFENIPINETDRVKGVEYDLLKHAKTDKEKYAASHSSVGSVLGAAGQNALKLSTTSVGKDVVDSDIKSRIELFDREKAKFIMESANVVEEYNLWVNGEINKIIDAGDKAIKTMEIDKGTTNTSLQVMYGIVAVMKDVGVEESRIKDYLKGTFYYNTDDPVKIKKLLKARLDYNSHLTNILTKMVRLNYSILGYTNEEMEYIIKNLSKEDNTANQTVADIRRQVWKNRKKFIRNNGECVDLSPLGFGKIFITKGQDFKGINVNTTDDLDETINSGNELQAIDSAFQKAMSYDAVILCHGSSANDEDYENARELDPSLARKGEEGDSPISDRSKNKWRMQPIRSDRSKYYTVMDDFIKQLIIEGHKKILIGSCNPGSHKLSKEVMSVPGIIINYSDYSNIIESKDEDTEFLNAIRESQQELITLAESYDIDYSSINYDEALLEYNDILNEGVIDNIKEFAKKVVKLVIGFFKKVWELIKNVFYKIKDKFGTKRNKSMPDEVTINTATIIVESAKVNHVAINNTKDFEKLIMDSCTRLQKEIQKRQHIQVTATTQLANLANKAKSTNESTVNEGYLNKLTFSFGIKNKPGSIAEIFKRHNYQGLLDKAIKVKSVEDINYLITDANSGITQFDKIRNRFYLCKTKGKCDETKKYYDGIQKLYVSKGVTLKDIDLTIKWYKEVYKPALRQRKKELLDSKPANESTVNEDSTTFATVVGPRSNPDSVYVVNYKRNNVFGEDENKYAVSDTPHLTRLFTFEDDGVEEITFEDFDKEAMYSETYLYEGYVNDFYKLLESCKTDVEFYTSISNLPYTNHNQIKYDNMFSKVTSLHDEICDIRECVYTSYEKINTIGVPYIPDLETMNESLVKAYTDPDGVYLLNESNGLRTPSVKNGNKISKQMIKFISGNL